MISIITSFVSWTCNAIVGGVGLAAVVFVVGSATKPSYESFATSFEAFQKLNGSDEVEEHHVQDCVVFTIIQSDFGTKTNIVEDVERKSIITVSATKRMLSFGFLNNWTHGSTSVSRTTSWSPVHS